MGLVRQTSQVIRSFQKSPLCWYNKLHNVLTVLYVFALRILERRKEKSLTPKEEEMRLMLCSFLFTLSVMVSLDVNAAERPTSDEAKGAWMTATPEEIDTAIQHILEKEPGHHMRRDDAARMELAEKIVEVGEELGIPPMLVLTIVFRESDFDEKAVGKLGELGLMQVAKMHVRNRECDMSNAIGQMTCGSGMLKEAFDLCHTWKGALTRYATKSGQCKSDDPWVQSKINLRLRDWQKLSRFVQSIYDHGDN